jgi:hypothetical protein
MIIWDPFWPLTGPLKRPIFSVCPFSVSMDQKIVLYVKKSADGQFTVKVMKKWKIFSNLKYPIDI